MTMETNVEIRTDKVCRACMKEASNMSYLFNKDAEAHLGKILSFITNMTVREDDKLPKHLCGDCVTIMNQAESFKRLCLETESKFKLLLQSLNVDSQYLETIEKPPIKHENYDAGNQCVLPYQCSYCAVKFGDIGDLVSHVATHDGVGNKSCIEAEHLTDRKDDIFNAGSDAVGTIKNTVKKVKEEFEDVVVEDVSELDENLFSNHFDSNMFVELPIKAKKKKRKACHRCLECSFLFESRKGLLNHERNIHGKRKVKKELESIEDICEDDKSISQLLKEAKESRHTCFICNYNCGSKNALLKHQRNKHPGKLKDLIRDLLQRDERQPHEIKDKPEPKHECSHCMRKFVKKTTLAAHLKRHSNPSSSHTCSICKREFMHRAHLDNHILKVHTSTNGLKCDFCPVSFATQDSLDVHKATHESDKRHKCQVCSKSFNMLSTLRDHLRTHTGEKPFLCPTCGKGFSQNTNLMEHLRRHQGIKPFKCEMCERRFVSKGELAAHHRKHSGAHPFVCDDCGNGFTTSSSLVKHRRTHTGERPYACDLCPMRFAASGTLKNHRRTHTGEKPYKCNHCEKAFVQKNDLVSHTRCHTGERPYVCSTCGQSFRQGSALKTHLKMHSVKDLHSIVYSAKDVEIRDY